MLGVWIFGVYVTERSFGHQLYGQESQNVHYIAFFWRALHIYVVHTGSHLHST